MIAFVRKRWFDILLGVFLGLMIFPQTRQPVQIFIQRLISTTPNLIQEENQEVLAQNHMLFENSNGEILNLSDYDNQIVLINFWATWCAPCIAEMPDFQNLYEDYHEDIIFFFITQDDWELVDKFEAKREFQLPYFKLIEPNENLNYRSLPTTYLIDKNGKILINKVGVADWDAAKFRTQLDELIAQ